MKRAASVSLLLFLLIPLAALAGSAGKQAPINLLLTGATLEDALRMAGPAAAEGFGDLAVSLHVRGVSRERYVEVLRRAAAGEPLEMADLEGFLHLELDGKNLLAGALERRAAKVPVEDDLSLEYFAHRRRLAEAGPSVPAGGAGWLGVELAGKTSETDRLAPEVRKAHEAWDGWGAFVRNVLPDSPAAATGLRPGDVVVRVGDIWVDSSCTLRRLISRVEPGREMEIAVLREGRVHLEWATIGERK